MNRDIYLKRLTDITFQVVSDVEVFGEVIPKGFITDGASVPKLFRPIISNFTKGFEAALVHDYQIHKNNTQKGRLLADIQFFHNLKYCGFSNLRAFICYLGVRLGSKVKFLRPR